MEKVLIVNDCKFEEVILKDLLENMGYIVKVEDESNVIDGVSKFSPDIVIINMVIRENKGNEVIEKIKKFNNKIKCILSSSTPLRLEDYENNGVDNIVHTPINKEKLIEALNLKKELSQCPYCGKNL